MRRRRSNERPSEHKLIEAVESLTRLSGELVRLGRTGEALHGLSTLLIASADQVLRIQTVDESNDLRPELSKTLDLIVEASEQVKSMAAVVEGRFTNAVDPF